MMEFGHQKMQSIKPTDWMVAMFCCWIEKFDQNSFEFKIIWCIHISHHTENIGHPGHGTRDRLDSLDTLDTSETLDTLDMTPGIDWTPRTPWTPWTPRKLWTPWTPQKLWTPWTWHLWITYHLISISSYSRLYSGIVDFLRGKNVT